MPTGSPPKTCSVPPTLTLSVVLAPTELIVLTFGELVTSTEKEPPFEPERVTLEGKVTLVKACALEPSFLIVKIPHLAEAVEIKPLGTVLEILHPFGLIVTLCALVVEIVPKFKSCVFSEISGKVFISVFLGILFYLGT